MLRADNHGEGGILSLITLVARPSASAPPSRARTVALLTALGILGASLFLADSMITPAISVLSAVEGLRMVEPGLEADRHPDHRRDHPVAVRRPAGRHRAGRPAVRAGDGAVVPHHRAPRGWRASSPSRRSCALCPRPTRSVSWPGRFEIAFFALAAVVLAITGAEALYADLGHFGRSADQPSLAASSSSRPAPCPTSGRAPCCWPTRPRTAPVRAPFFLLVPSWALIPLVVLATAATVIASQAVITGAFSVARQAIQLGYLPRLRIVHTSAQTLGQIYVPWVNWALMVMVIVLVLAFQSSAALAYAFGMAVTGTIIVTTLLLFYVARRQWGWPLWAVLLGGGRRPRIEGLFLAANLTKLVSGAWLPLLIGLIIFTVMSTWQRGRRMVTERREDREGSLRQFVDDLHEQRPPIMRVPGTAIFLNRSKAHRAAGHAGERRAQPGAARARFDRRGRDGAGAGVAARTSPGRRSWATGTTASPWSRCGSATCSAPTSPGPRRLPAGAVRGPDRPRRTPRTSCPPSTSSSASTTMPAGGRCCSSPPRP